jgi:hypothetical protein
MNDKKMIQCFICGEPFEQITQGQMSCVECYDKKKSEWKSKNIENKVNFENKCADILRDFEYEDNALNNMMKLQLNLQLMYGKKRNIITPEYLNELRISESIYYFSCFTAELWEFQERINSQIKNENEKKEALLELVDCWHFLMNIFLYIGIREFNEDLGFYWSYNNHIGYDPRFIAYNIIMCWGKILDELPYKKWKTYDNYDFNKKRVYKIAEDMLCNFVVFCKCYGMTKEMFFSYYICKNKENINRQKEGGIYEK